MEKRSMLVAKSLGEDALKALESGGEWEWKSELDMHSDWWVYECGDNDCQRQWHKNAYLTGYSVRDGKVFHDIHTIDEDGDEDFLDSCDVDSADYEEWCKEYGEDERQDGWGEYARHVADTGQDPLHEYIVDRTHVETWNVRVYQGTDGIYFLGANKGIGYVDRVAIKDPSLLPIDVREFLAFDERMRVGGYETLDQLKGENYRVESHQRITDGEIFNMPKDGIAQVRGDLVTISFNVHIPDKPAIIEDRLKRAALSHLED